MASSSSKGIKAKQISSSIKGKPGTNHTSNTASKSQTKTTVTTVLSSGSSTSTDSYILFWLDSNIDVDDGNCYQTIVQLQSVVSNVHVFNDDHECANYLQQIRNQKVFLVVSGSLGEAILPHIHNMSQLTAVFIYCSNRSKYESLLKRWSKVRGIFTDIGVLCGSVNDLARKYDEDSIDVSFLSPSDKPNESLNDLDQSFMYTQLIKEILFELKHDDNDDSVKKLVTYCLDKFPNDKKKTGNVNEFQTGYQTRSPIWWYTCECFLYHVLNWALRHQEFDAIIRLAFFINDLHRHIKQLHSNQSKQFSKEFTVYRGQGMELEKFKKMKSNKGGLISFNNFLSTSRNPAVAKIFTNNGLNDSNLVSILFIMKVDPSKSSAPFASLDNVSCYKEKEKEILFSMHTVFRINDIIQDDKNDQLWTVNLTLTSDTDKQLNNLTERMRTEIEGATPLYRLGALMIKVGEYTKAEEIYKTLDERTSDELERANINYQLGSISDNNHEYKKALSYYQYALNQYLKNFEPNHPNIASCYNNIGLVYDNMEDYQKALPYYEKALTIYRETLDDNHPNIGVACNSIGLIYNNLGNYSKAISFCKQALDIFQESLPPTHPMLATAYNNIGLIYGSMKQYSEAIASYKRAVDIGQKVLPQGHPALQAYRKNLESVPKKGNK